MIAPSARRDGLSWMTSIPPPYQYGTAFGQLPPPSAPLLSHRHYASAQEAAFYAGYPPSQQQYFGAGPMPSPYYPSTQQHPVHAAYPTQAAAYDLFAFHMPPPPYRSQEAYGLPQQQQQQQQWPAEGVWGSDSRQPTYQQHPQALWANRAGGEPLHPPGVIGSQSARSRASRSTADYDHPSFDRPPHRDQLQQQTYTAPPAAAASRAPTPVAEPSAPTEPIEYDLISNTSTVPPPPPIERSAVPLADLAVEMVWEAVALGVSSPGLLGHQSASPNLRASLTKSPVSPTTRGPELFGAIGEGRQRKISAGSKSEGYGSIGSSPASSAGPGTPSGVSAVEAATARKQRLAGLGFAFPSPCSGDDVKAEHLSPDTMLLDSPIEAIRTHARNLNSRAMFPSEPTPAFRQFVKQVLTATLVAPEDLIHALYYVAQIPKTSMIPPTTTEFPAGSAGARASAVKAAPFKIFLGALMIANKTLQDNSYRNEIWSLISSIPLKDVNQLEVFVFGALGFDVAMQGDAWRTWLDVVRQRSRSHTGDIGDQSAVYDALHRLHLAAHNASSSPFNSPVQRPAPATTDDFDFDALGPLQSPPASSRTRDRHDRFVQGVHESPMEVAVWGDSKSHAFPTSFTRSYGSELCATRV